MKLSIQIPVSDMHPLTRLTVRSDKWETTTTLDDTHKVLEMELPNGLTPDDVEVLVEYCIRDGVTDKNLTPICLKPRVAKAKVEPKKAEPKPEPKPAKVETAPVAEVPTAE